MNPVTSIYREFTRGEGRPLNILCSPTHERYESTLAKTGHNFYGITATDGNNVAVQGMKPWNETFAKRPSNYRLVGNTLPIDVGFDLVLSQNKFGQFQNLAPIARALQIPLISLEHTLPIPMWRPEALEQCRSFRGDKNVFISRFSQKEWFPDETFDIIEHGVDTNTFSLMGLEREPVCMSVVNDWINRDWCCGFGIWQSIVQGTLPVKVLGDTKGLSKPAESIEHLVTEYNKSLIFINTSTISPIPTSLLEAMSCGCAVVTTATCMIPEVIKDGYNGFLSNNPEELRERCIFLIQNPEIARKIGLNARKTIEEKFSVDRFVADWNRLFYSSLGYKNAG
jgi:hypothetical protein